MPETISQKSNLPPPSADPAKAEKYVDQLLNLIELDKLTIYHTDLARFDPSSLQDHFRIDLQDYQVEISHSKHPNSGKDSFVMLFSNLKNVANGSCEKVILAYMHLDDSQFMRFRKSYAQQVERIKRAEEEKRLKDALIPVDQVLEELSKSEEAPMISQNDTPSSQTPAVT